jgi:hypothetical protein
VTLIKGLELQHAQKSTMRRVLILWYLREVFTSTCKPDENRIFWEARRNPN